MEFFVCFLFFLTFSVLTAVISYYVNLLFFQRKAVYDREEITQVLEPSLKIFYEMLDSKGNIGPGVGLFLGFGFFSYLISLIGGLVGSPHYSSSWGNYFFHFPILSFCFLFAFPFLEEGFGRGQFRFFFKSGRAVLSGLGLGSCSASFTSWGLYHDFSFFYCLFTLVALCPLVFTWNSQVFLGIRIGPVPSPEPSWEEEPSFTQGPSSLDDDLDFPNEETASTKGFGKSGSDTTDPDSLDWDDFEPAPHSPKDKDPW